MMEEEELRDNQLMLANQEIATIQDRRVLSYLEFPLFDIELLEAKAVSFTRFGGMVIAIFADGHAVCTQLGDGD